MGLIVLIVTAIGIATPANGEDEAMAIFKALGRADSLLAQGQSDQALDEYVGVRKAFARYMVSRGTARLYNRQALIFLYLGYREAAESLQKSLAEDPTQESLFTILEKVMLENIELYDRVAIVLDEIGLSAEAHEFREQVKDRRYFAETLTAALEPLRKKSREEAMDLFSPEFRELLTE